MRILHEKLAQAVEKGLAVQVVLADEEGLVLENIGDAFPPEALAGDVLAAAPALESLEERLNIGPLCRSTICFEGKDLIISASRILPQEGEIVHASCGVLEGKEALYRCLCFDGGVCRHLSWREPEKVTINSSATFLLMEAARRRDEAFSAEP
jgi:hypothetical protein